MPITAQQLLQNLLNAGAKRVAACIGQIGSAAWFWAANGQPMG